MSNRMRITNATLIKVQLDDRIPTPHFTLNIYFLVYRFIFISYPCTVKQEKKNLTATHRLYVILS